MTTLTWNQQRTSGGHSLRGYLDTPWSFEETVARLAALSDQEPALATVDGKVSVQFHGTFHGCTFSLYDYKQDYRLHIGGTDALDTVALAAALRAALETVRPRSYDALLHAWPTRVAAADVR